MKYVLEVLFPYIFLLYIFDCITYVKARQVLLTSLLGKKFDLKRPGVHLAGLLPISQTIISHRLAVHYSRDGIYAVFDGLCPDSGPEKARDFNFIEFQDLKRIEAEGKNIRFNGTHTIQTPSPLFARFHAKFINELKRLNPADRKEKIESYLSDSYNLEAINKIATSNLKSLAIIKILGSLLCVLVFFILPAALFSDLCKYLNLSALVICTALIYSLLLVVSLLTLKKLYPAENNVRFHTLLSIVFAPVNAIHVLSYLTKDLYVRFNHVAVAAYFLPRDCFKELARKEIFLIDYLENGIDRQDWIKFWGLKKELLRGLLGKCGVSRHEIQTPPEKKDQTAVCYCPFCMSEYREKRPNCIDCEMALKEFDKEERETYPRPALTV